jgi:ribosomal protein L40E
MVRGFDLVLVGFLVIVAPFAILFFLAIGPVGWLLIGGGLIVAGIIQTIADDEAETSAVVEGVNCPECGARNEVEGDHCEYCGSTLERDGERSGPNARK